MAGGMRKMGVWLGLVEDDDDRRYDAEYDGYDDDAPPAPAGRGRGYADSEGYEASERTQVAPVRRGYDDRGRRAETPVTRGSLAVDTRPAPAVQHRVEETPVMDQVAYRITTLHPRTYNEARTIGEHFREGVPVIMNLTEMDDADAKRLVDFAAGLSFGLRGSIERVTNKVFLLSPQNVEVTAEDKARIAEGGFFNQS